MRRKINNNNNNNIHICIAPYGRNFRGATHLESDPTIHLLWGYDHFIYDDMMDSPEKCTIVSKPLLLPCCFWRICGIYVEFLPFPAVITAVTAV